MYSSPTATRRPSAAAVDSLIEEGRRVETAARHFLRAFGVGVFGVPRDFRQFEERLRAARMAELERRYRNSLRGRAR
jgi:hypothetical protein